ncbi:hypothetical protein NBRC111894_2903 [Sporolactobacillus inulinus]|uniref:Uncharacterized protein n=1 Tax=Sporolactobacillus inulinus TaxID=2078 RepID=A0A4Y1ZEB9_9BACL|nr:hypothetical protein NBRC111894_2903 [Sporolactobacillus inulinus]
MAEWVSNGRKRSAKERIDCKSHPLLPQGTPVIGLVIDPKTGELKQV